MIIAKLPSSVSDFLFSDFPFCGTIVTVYGSVSESPLRVRASIMIFAKFLSSVSDFPFLVGNPEELSFGQFRSVQSYSPLQGRASIMIFGKFPSSVLDFPFFVWNSDKLSFGQFRSVWSGTVRS